jgi:hypothetical protein
MPAKKDTVSPRDSDCRIEMSIPQVFLSKTTYDSNTPAGAEH